MTNEEIIMEARVKLMEEGKIEKLPSGLPAEIRTVGQWKFYGFKVRDGEKPVTKLKIWRIAQNGKPFLKEANFYTRKQCE